MSIRIAFALVNRASVNFVEAGSDNAGAPPSRSAGMRLSADGGYSGSFRPQFGQKAYSGPVFSPQ